MAPGRNEILTVIREILLPLVAADGGRLYLVDIEGDLVRLHVTGTFSGCPGNTLVSRRFMEPAIQRVLPDAEVLLTSGILIPKGAELIS
jgi:Fe-S cluster biogenesis protein NfuA